MAGPAIPTDSALDALFGRGKKIMANDEEWVADVKRWYLAGTRTATGVGIGPDEVGDEVALGYEAADPALQARHWPDAPTTGR